MENPTSEIHDWDWELIPNSSSNNNNNITTKSPSSTSSIGGGVIHSEYFSLYSDMNYTATISTDDGAVTNNNSSDEVEEGDSDNPSWVDPSYSTVVCGNNNNNNGTGGGKRKRSVSPASSSSYSPSSDELDLIQPHSDCCGAGFSDQFPNSSEIGQNSGGNDAEDNSVVGSFDGNDQNGGGNDVEVNSGNDGDENDQVSGLRLEETKGEENENENENEEKRVVWWKVPMEVLRYCVLRVSPVWSLSMAAAALMGLVILRRRYLQKIKRKSLGIQLKVAVDDKKVSQVMSRVARLNEAFSVVKRVPIIRPALPAPGMAPWPVMSLR